MQDLFYLIGTIAKPFCPPFEGDGSSEGSSSEGAGDATTSTSGSSDNSSGGSEERTFNQEAVNKMLAADRYKHKEQLQKVMDELDAIKAKSTLSNEERSELEQRLEETRNQLLTKEEIAKKDKAKLQEQLSGRINELETELTSFKTKYESETIERNITDAAVNNDAFSPGQIVAMLRPNTRLAEVTGDDGKPTGQMIPRVSLQDVDAEGKPTTLDLTVEEAVKRMREMPNYLNLFKGDGVSGLGAGTQSAGRTTAAKNLSTEEYIRARQSGKLNL